MEFLRKSITWSAPPFIVASCALFFAANQIFCADQLFPRLARLFWARLSSLVSLSVAVSAVPVWIRLSLQPFQTQLLRPAQAMCGHYVPALEECAAPSPRDASPGQPDAAALWSIGQKAAGCVGQGDRILIP